MTPSADYPGPNCALRYQPDRQTLRSAGTVYWPGARHALRARLGIAEGDFAALFVGRLSFHAKAHPTPLLLAAARAAERAQGRTVHLLLAGQLPNRAAEKEFREAADRFGGAARVHFIDGSDGPHGPVMRSAWRAADIFVSLSDNIQETFGLTPVEAMAAGLPCVVSDWNGYKDTVADGETGFRIPTTTIGPGAGIDVADRHAAGVDSYDQMIGITSLATAVDVDACADAIVRLAGDAELRHRQGQAAIARARRLYDWRAVVAAYQDLWRELAELRAASPRPGASRPRGGGANRRPRPVRRLPALCHGAARRQYGGGREGPRRGRGAGAAAQGRAEPAPVGRLRLPVGRRGGCAARAAGIVAGAAGGPGPRPSRRRAPAAADAALAQEVQPGGIPPTRDGAAGEPVAVMMRPGTVTPGGRGPGGDSCYPGSRGGMASTAAQGTAPGTDGQARRTPGRAPGGDHRKASRIGRTPQRARHSSRSWCGSSTARAIRAMMGR